MKILTRIACLLVITLWGICLILIIPLIGIRKWDNTLNKLFNKLEKIN